MQDYLAGETLTWHTGPVHLTQGPLNITILAPMAFAFWVPTAVRKFRGFVSSTSELLKAASNSPQRDAFPRKPKQVIVGVRC